MHFSCNFSWSIVIFWWLWVRSHWASESVIDWSTDCQYCEDVVDVFRIILSQPDPVCSTAQCAQSPDESCHCADTTAGGGVSFSQPTHLDNLLVSTQLMGTPGTSQVRCLVLKIVSLSHERLLWHYDDLFIRSWTGNPEVMVPVFEACYAASALGLEPTTSGMQVFKAV